MIDKLLGKIEFEEPLGLTEGEYAQEAKLEEKHLDLFVYNSPANNANGIGKHLSHFSRKFYPLPCYLIDIEDWLDDYSYILMTDKKFKNFKQYPSDDLKIYLLHKTFICKVVRHLIYSTNPDILKAVNHIKLLHEAHMVIGKAEKYLALKLNVNTLSESDFNDIKRQIAEAKEEAQ